MKRVILILAGLVIALALFNRFGNPQRSAGEKSTTNATISHPTFHSSHRVVHAARTDLTNSVAADHDEEADAPKKLSREQIDAYLLKTKRSSESLLNAFQETGDTNYLAEAVAKDLNNPLVQWTMLNQELSPEERTQWLEKLKVSSPDNALPNYLSAKDYFKTGNIDQALAEIDSAKTKKINSYEQERAQSREEMYLLSGYSPFGAKEKGLESLTLPNLREMKELSQQVGELQQKYKLAGDDGSNQQLAAIGIEMGRKYSESNSPVLINQLVGYAMENIALNNLDPETYYDFLGETAGQRIQEIKDRKRESKDLYQPVAHIFPTLSDAEKMIYLNRQELYGELNAMRWFNKRYGTESK